jgi:hypothetical protein
VSHIYGVISLEKKENKVIIEKNSADILDYIKAGIFLLIALPFIIISFVFVAILAFLTHGGYKKCQHWRECPWYNEKDRTCVEDMGMYHNYDKPSGCYHSISEKKEELKKQGKKLRKLR